MARKTKKKDEDVEAYRHEAETRKNAVPVDLASYDTPKPKPKKYEYGQHLDHCLVWTRKAEHMSEIPPQEIYIQFDICKEIA